MQARFIEIHHVFAEKRSILKSIKVELYYTKLNDPEEDAGGFEKPLR